MPRGPEALPRPGKALPPSLWGLALPWHHGRGVENRALKGPRGLRVLGRHLQKSVCWRSHVDLKNKKQSPGSHVLRT